MAAAGTLIWLAGILFMGGVSGQTLGIQNGTYKGHGICKAMMCNSIEKLKALQECVVIFGNLHIALLERATKEDYENITFTNLREVTGYVVFYRVFGLESLGQLFPNLARIRGAQLLINYGLIINDMQDLREIGLYSLLKIDRGGVIIWAAPQTCFVDSIDWNTIAPRSRHVLSFAEKLTHCNVPCTCSRNASLNRCWNMHKCQRFLDGPESDDCHEQCLGCRKTKRDMCTVCRNYTNRGNCVSSCPKDTVVLTVNKYCLTVKECEKLEGWTFNNTCVFECPVEYVKKNNTGVITCEHCADCFRTCGRLNLQTLGGIQAAERCVFINGSLVIHVRALPDVMQDLRTYLSRIQEVSDYIFIFGSITITSLDFLPSLRRIGGKKLLDDKYSLMINDMSNLQTLFTPNVMENLKVDNGTLKITDNRLLCMSHIKKLRKVFPKAPDEAIDIPEDTNGYSGGCSEVALGLQIRVVNETNALLMFSPSPDINVQYSVLYVRLPYGTNESIVPETCSEFEWNAVTVPTQFAHYAMIELSSLHPASTYAVCVETYHPIERHLARSTIINFTTPIGKPEPPFILELVASSAEVVVLRWVDHKLYRPHITYYELDVVLIDIYEKDVKARDHCKDLYDSLEEIDYSRHAVVMRPPPEYDRGCESMCGVLSAATLGAMVEEHFDVCSYIENGCNNNEEDSPGNTTFGKYVRSMSLNISIPKRSIQIAGLAPFRDYRFRLRACVGNNCSRSRRGVVRTLQSKSADVPTLTTFYPHEQGSFYLEWEPPEVSNGPVLAYAIEVLPKIVLSDVSRVLPQMWCVPGNETSLFLEAAAASKYSLRVCSKTLVPLSSCSEWVKVNLEIDYTQWWWSGIIFAMILYVTSCIVGYLYKRRRIYSDLAPLVDTTAMYRNETDPVTFTSSDFLTFGAFPFDHPLH